MNALFSSTVKSGLIALGIVSGVTAPSAAGPILQPDVSIPASTAAPTVTPVREGWAGGNNRSFNNDWRWRRSGNWNGRHWNGGGNWSGRHWNGGGNWNRGDDWRWRHGRRYYHGGYYDDGAAAILGLGLGLGLGSMYNNYNNYDYYAPAPRRYYRAGRLSSAHVRWCYNRYRSYRAYDNTFQPYNGPRQQCWSPYS
ncbi:MULTISPECIES: BA14K family protein [unclassified Mesorhizobium]|uniref:BA14K family protein n=1 Tax=unclassified Mesorhizobium TaxID=325217 RepID=UPI000FCB2482|nr:MULTISPECIES: BA14K family protein [unclassified Mesorhizobium]RUW95063.1 BA14K family protein [Mesorhizobium sp. M8A.F.Ca.ET.023.01.1.1]RUX06790.1 BA14K family protein [Mesorhizobium sp. M8A.F.Ca.ET.059.01.1.1]TGV60981.1 BA14K family protein [bacterium M00.F.Ca.ET.141.01.1.1]RUW48620.1 BA14K family protein [Mesorhizobium sp. M8A.F.Ca.ET.021.01.1.1]RWC77676.1 MAG: BA14K family protein [Mesorhizobium sp.]